jgi:ABC-2 type transport system permease protein
MNLRRIAHIVKKELIQLRRDPRLLPILFIAPVFQLFVFGYAATTDVRNVRTAVYDEDRSAQSRGLVERFLRSGYFQLQRVVRAPEEVDAPLDSGAAQLVIHIPPTFAEDLASGRTAQVQLILDGSDSMTAGIVSGYVSGVVSDYSRDIASARLERFRAAAPMVPGIEERLRVWYNPELRSVNYMVPGVLGSLMLLVTMVLTSLAIVKEREVGTLEQLIVTPITPRELMLGKTIPFAIIGFADLALVTVVAVVWFGVPLAGSVLLLFLLTTAFLLASLGSGLLISTVSRTQQQAMMVSFFVMLPSIVLSGFMFPIENMPRVIQAITYLIPLRYYMTIVRGLFLKGSGLAVLWPHALALLVLGAGIMVLSAARFTKRVS